ncbi:hypothetical protein HAX54_032922 [Datura stramonium]|uniref:Protein kinase domain-containing protein n=1 Tax=Datura stramonium TaxID=4076 RepID=A0ABS8SCX7_DATST|nr:hypothetical protein [Datura stramonium]
MSTCLSIANITTDQTALLSLQSQVSLYDSHNVLARNWSTFTPQASSSTFQPPNLGQLWIVSHREVHQAVAKGHQISRKFIWECNNLSGVSPASILNASRLTVLDLSNNTFSGSIPDSLESFGKLISLEFLDLSYNNLTGEIPKSLEALVYLKYLTVSFNKLSGEIQPVVLLQTSPISRLCSTTHYVVSRLHAASLRQISSEDEEKRVLTGLWTPMKEFHIMNFNKQTNGFSEDNLLVLSFSRVYKGVKDGTIFAAKVFKPELEGAFKSFDTECEILRNLRHRNLTKRLDIMIDVASALDYLHNGYSEPVVQRIILDKSKTIGTIDIAPEYGQDDFINKSDGTALVL